MNYHFEHKFLSGIVHPVLLCILLTLLTHTAFAQFGQTIRSGRPGASIGPYTVGKNVFQIQTGFNYNETTITSDNAKNIWIWNSVLRYGVLEKLEVNGLINLQTEDITANGMNEIQSGVSNTQLGLRYNFTGNREGIPALGLQGRLLLKAQSEEYQRENLGMKFIFITGNKITDWLSLTTNWGITWSGDGGDPVGNYSINTSFGLTEKLGAFIEVFGVFSPFSSNYDSGLTYLLNNDLQLDVSTGWQGQNGLVDWFVDFGVSWRLHNRD
jgi:hypothetical protein